MNPSLKRKAEQASLAGAPPASKVGATNTNVGSILMTAKDSTANERINRSTENMNLQTEDDTLPRSPIIAAARIATCPEDSGAPRQDGVGTEIATPMAARPDPFRKGYQYPNQSLRGLTTEMDDFLKTEQSKGVSPADICRALNVEFGTAFFPHYISARLRKLKKGNNNGVVESASESCIDCIEKEIECTHNKMEVYRAEVLRRCDRCYQRKLKCLWKRDSACAVCKKDACLPIQAQSLVDYPLETHHRSLGERQPKRVPVMGTDETPSDGTETRILDRHLDNEFHYTFPNGYKFINGPWQGFESGLMALWIAIKLTQPDLNPDLLQIIYAFHKRLMNDPRSMDVEHRDNIGDNTILSAKQLSLVVKDYNAKQPHQFRLHTITRSLGSQPIVGSTNDASDRALDIWLYNNEGDVVGSSCSGQWVAIVPGDTPTDGHSFAMTTLLPIEPIGYDRLFHKSPADWYQVVLRAFDDMETCISIEDAATKYNLLCTTLRFSRGLFEIMSDKRILIEKTIQDYLSDAFTNLRDAASRCGLDEVAFKDHVQSHHNRKVNDDVAMTSTRSKFEEEAWLQAVIRRFEEGAYRNKGIAQKDAGVSHKTFIKGSRRAEKSKKTTEDVAADIESAKGEKATRMAEAHEPVQGKHHQDGKAAASEKKQSQNENESLEEDPESVAGNSMPDESE